MNSDRRFLRSRARNRYEKVPFSGWILATVPCNRNPFLSGSLSFSIHLPYQDSLRPFFSYSFTFVLRLVLWFKVFLFARARIATDDEGVLLFPRDLHKISILEARPGKNIGESRGPDDESLLLKPALLALTYTERVTKEKSLFSRLGPISRLRPVFSPRLTPLALSYTLPIHPRIRDHLAFVGDLLDSLPFCFFVLFLLAP